MELPAQLRDITVDDPAAVLKQIHIRGVTHFGITAGGVNLHGAFVESAGAVYEGVRVSGVLPVIPGILLVISGGIFPPYAELQKRIRKTVQVADLKALRMVTNRLGSNTGASVYSLKPSMYCI